MKLQSINPHDQSVIGEVKVTSPAQINKTVAKAKQAFKTWRFTPLGTRVEYLKRFRQKVVAHQEELSRLVTLEMGKPIKQSRDDIPWELEYIDYYIQAGPTALAEETLLNHDQESYRITYEPYGVCACIAPWNFPLSMFDSGVLPALLAGNTVVFKPSEYTTLSQKLAADLLLETGLPEGVFNLILGGKDTGKALVDSPIDLVWFTGSTKAGLEIYKKAGAKFIRAICELGGSSAGLVFADADLQVTMDNLYWARFLNCGQVCSAVKRLFVEKPVYNQVLEQYLERLKRVKIGNPLDEDTDFGPLVFPEQVSKMEEVVANAKSKGAQVVIGGSRPSAPQLQKGNYFLPTILTHVSFDMRVMQEETFGPILPIMSFESEAEAVSMANHTDYGLTSEVYTTDLQKADRVARQLDSGVVAINTDSFYKPICPIGGYKKSGIGREYGRIGFQEFAQIKLLALKSL